jgi:DNA-nicking Smr family endonuclease
VNPESDDDEDWQLFRNAVRDVKPLGSSQPVGRTGTPSSRFRSLRRNRNAMVDEKLPVGIDAPPIEREDELSFRRQGVQNAVLRKLRSGELGIQGEIDLHGLNGEQAARALQEFMSHAIARHARCVRIIHGKGLRSNERLPVLKNLVSNLLRRMPAVMAFVSARHNDGGTGATYVLLRS